MQQSHVVLPKVLRDTMREVQSAVDCAERALPAVGRLPEDERRQLLLARNIYLASLVGNLGSILIEAVGTMASEQYEDYLRWFGPISDRIERLFQ